MDIVKWVMRNLYICDLSLIDIRFPVGSYKPSPMMSTSYAPDKMTTTTGNTTIQPK